ncbi:site-specific integrase [Thiomicrorhabdus indica]|uniref:site-specific integrase n=1 Tax=Thiomicrorhabdus indica TaxID=2267253 RepID=UPI002AA6B579|nr:site-specific integrase [Thiomicrorhabdus indica]
MASIRCRKDSKKLFFDFTFRGLRCREQTALDDTPANRKKLEKVLERIQAEITLGQFEYAKYFPKSKMLGKLQRIEAQDKIRQGLAVDSPSFATFSNQFFDELRPTWRDSTAESYRGYLDNYLIPYFGEMKVSEITKSDILTFRSQATKLGNRALKPKTINKFVKFLKMILNEAADRFNFRAVHTNIKSLKEEKVHIEPFSIDEVNRMINTVRKDWRVYLLVRFFTGMRTGEIDGLTWENVDFENRQILIRQMYSKGKFQSTKTEDLQREIDMPQIVFDALVEHLRSSDGEGLVFTSGNGSPVNNPNFLSRVWKPLLRLLKIPYRRPYQTRHTAATMWLAAGENPTWIAKQMGHSNTEMLFKVYSRYVPNMPRQDGSAAESLFAASIKVPNLTVKTTENSIPTAGEELEFWDQFLNTSASMDDFGGVK